MRSTWGVRIMNYKGCRSIFTCGMSNLPSVVVTHELIRLQLFLVLRSKSLWCLTSRSLHNILNSQIKRNQTHIFLSHKKNYLAFFITTCSINFRYQLKRKSQCRKKLRLDIWSFIWLLLFNFFWHGQLILLLLLLNTNLIYVGSNK